MVADINFCFYEAEIIVEHGAIGKALCRLQRLSVVNIVFCKGVFLKTGADGTAPLQCFFVEFLKFIKNCPVPILINYFAVIFK